MADSRALAETSIGRFLVYAGPLLWAVLIVFHPNPGGDSSYEGIADVVDRWLFVHVGQLILTPFLFLAVWRLLDGLSSAAATVSRAALVVWTVFFSAYDSVQGIARWGLRRKAPSRGGSVSTSRLVVKRAAGGAALLI
jgi:drug/metabolite transporter (DMT)-like permease